MVGSLQPILRVRTGYSFRSAAGSLENAFDRLKAIADFKEGGEFNFAPITDRASTFGWVRWAKMCKKAGVKPVFGVELAVTDSFHAKKPSYDHWTFIAKDNLKDINDLVNLATQQFRFRPLLTYDQAQAVNAYKIVGHRANLELVKPSDDLFLAVGPSSVKGYVNLARKNGIRLAASSDNKYCLKKDRGLWEIICGIGAETQSYEQHILTEEEWKESVDHLDFDENELAEMMANSRSILEGSTAKLVKAEMLHPERPAPLLQMCEEGAAKLGCDLTDPVYRARLDRELALIHEKKFEDYFYIVTDICQFARANLLVGPARGSSCGSLVCYLLGITTVDPIPYGLIFERFIDINRNDLPDIDIDFSDQKRQLVFDYVASKYGSDRIARLGTVAMFKPRSALQEASGALRIPKWKCDAVADSLIERSSGDSRALNTLEDTLNTMPAGQELLRNFPEVLAIVQMEGHPRHYSQHAAGIIITQKPTSEYVAVDHRSGATMCDKKDAEELDLLKIDALGLTQLSVFEDALEMAGLPAHFLETIPMDDPSAFEVLNKQHFSGIFQFNGMALQSITKQFEVTEFNDIVSVTALGRPGPMSSGGSSEWVRRRNGENPVTYPHPIFEPFLNDTLGIVLYQEQVMEIGRQVGGLDWGQVTALRKAMSKSLGKEYFDQFGDPWKAGAIAKGVDPKHAEKVWDDLCAYGAWSFNKSHSVAYGIISYQCCYLKAHYPFEFAAATLTHEDDPARQLLLLREMALEGYDYIPVDKHLSTDKWTVGVKHGKKYLIGPLTNVKGIGPKMLHQIIGARARGERMPERAAKLLENPKTSIDSLFPIRDKIREIMPDPSERQIFTPPTNIKDIVIKPDDQTVLVFCTFSKINPRDENEAVNVAKRGYELKGPTQSLNLQITDDTDTIFGKVDRFKFNELGKSIVDRGRVGKALYAVKGRVRGGGSFRMINVQAVRYIGDLDQ